MIWAETPAWSAVHRQRHDNSVAALLDSIEIKQRKQRLLDAIARPAERFEIGSRNARSQPNFGELQVRKVADMSAKPM